LRLMDHVAVGQDKTIGRENETRAAAMQLIRAAESGIWRIG